MRSHMTQTDSSQIAALLRLRQVRQLRPDPVPQAAIDHQLFRKFNQYVISVTAAARNRTSR